MIARDLTVKINTSCHDCLWVFKAVLLHRNHTGITDIAFVIALCFVGCQRGEAKVLMVFNTSSKLLHGSKFIVQSSKLKVQFGC